MFEWKIAYMVFNHYIDMQSAISIKAIQFFLCVYTCVFGNEKDDTGAHQALARQYLTHKWSFRLVNQHKANNLLALLCTWMPF